MSLTAEDKLKFKQLQAIYGETPGIIDEAPLFEQLSSFSSLGFGKLNDSVIKSRKFFEGVEDSFSLNFFKALNKLILLFPNSVEEVQTTDIRAVKAIFMFYARMKTLETKVEDKPIPVLIENVFKRCNAFKEKLEQLRDKQVVLYIKGKEQAAEETLNLAKAVFSEIISAETELLKGSPSSYEQVCEKYNLFEELSPKLLDLKNRTSKFSETFPHFKLPFLSQKLDEYLASITRYQLQASQFIKGIEWYNTYKVNQEPLTQAETTLKELLQKGIEEKTFNLDAIQEQIAVFQETKDFIQENEVVKNQLTEVLTSENAQVVTAKFDEDKNHIDNLLSYWNSLIPWFQWANVNKDTMSATQIAFNEISSLCEASKSTESLVDLTEINKQLEIIQSISGQIALPSEEISDSSLVTYCKVQFESIKVLEQKALKQKAIIVQSNEEKRQLLVEKDQISQIKSFKNSVNQFFSKAQEAFEGLKLTLLDLLQGKEIQETVLSPLVEEIKKQNDLIEQVSTAMTQFEKTENLNVQSEIESFKEQVDSRLSDIKSYQLDATRILKAHIWFAEFKNQNSDFTQASETLSQLSQAGLMNKKFELTAIQEQLTAIQNQIDVLFKQKQSMEEFVSLLTEEDQLLLREQIGQYEENLNSCIKQYQKLIPALNWLNEVNAQIEAAGKTSQLIQSLHAEAMTSLEVYDTHVLNSHLQSIEERIQTATPSQEVKSSLSSDQSCQDLLNRQLTELNTLKNKGSEQIEEVEENNERILKERSLQSINGYKIRAVEYLAEAQRASETIQSSPISDGFFNTLELNQQLQCIDENHKNLLALQTRLQTEKLEGIEKIQQLIIDNQNEVASLLKKEQQFVENLERLNYLNSETIDAENVIQEIRKLFETAKTDKKKFNLTSLIQITDTLTSHQETLNSLSFSDKPELEIFKAAQCDKISALLSHVSELEKEMIRHNDKITTIIMTRVEKTELLINMMQNYLTALENEPSQPSWTMNFFQSNRKSAKIAYCSNLLSELNQIQLTAEGDFSKIIHGAEDRALSATKKSHQLTDLTAGGSYFGTSRMLSLLRLLNTDVGWENGQSKFLGLPGSTFHGLKVTGVLKDKQALIENFYKDETSKQEIEAFIKLVEKTIPVTDNVKSVVLSPFN